MWTLTDPVSNELWDPSQTHLLHTSYRFHSQFRHTEPMAPPTSGSVSKQEQYPTGDLVEPRVVERGVQINTLDVFHPERREAANCEELKWNSSFWESRLTCCQSAGAPSWTRLPQPTWSHLCTGRFHGDPQTGTCQHFNAQALQTGPTRSEESVSALGFVFQAKWF